MVGVVMEKIPYFKISMKSYYLSFYIGLNHILLVKT